MTAQPITPKRAEGRGAGKVSARTAARVAWLIWGLCVALLVARWLLDSMTPPLPIRGGDYSALDVLFEVPRLAFPSIGAFLAARRPENPTGWLFCAMSLADLTQGFTMAYADYAVHARSGMLPSTAFMAWVSHWIGFPGVFLGAVFLFLLFPTGSLPSRRWRYLPWIAVVGSVLLALGDALRPGRLMTHPSIANPFGVDGLLFGMVPAPQVWGVATGVGAALLGASALASVTSLFLRLRRARGEERQQIKWLAYAAAVMVVSFTVARLFWVLASQWPSLFSPWALLNEIAFHMGFVGYLLLPVAAAVAILRYRLYDIDLIINRTLVYGALTVTLGLVYLGSVVVLRGLLFGFRETSEVAIVASTLLIAALFNPLRSRLQRGVNRLMYGERDDPYAVLSRLGKRLEATLTPGDALPTIVETIAQALRLPYAAITLRRGDEFETAAEYGSPAGRPLILPLTYGPETVGQLVLAPRAPGEAFTKSDLGLLEDLARQVGVVAHAMRLTTDLQRSRERLVTAREEERRRLRRELHDGVGPQLAALTLKLETARRKLAHDPTADALLSDLGNRTRAAVADIRRAVYALRPPALDEFGLVPVLRETAAQYGQSGPNISVEAPESLPPLPAAVEVAAYRIAGEAMNNAVRHAEARACTVSIALDGDTLRLEVSDDGRGIAEDHRPGVGLRSMRERAEELGGSCEISSRPGGGTCVSARLPYTPLDDARRSKEE